MITYAPLSRFHRMQVSVRAFFSLTRASWRETLALMVVAWLVPLLVHLIPWSGSLPLGGHLLPAFWTAFVAVYLYGCGIGLLVALVVPVANLLTTGLPALERVAPMMIELATFVMFAGLLLQRWPSLRLSALLAWVPAKTVAILIQWSVPWFDYTRNPVDHFLGMLSSVLAGLGVLLALNVALVHLLPKDQSWDAD